MLRSRGAARPDPLDLDPARESAVYVTTAQAAAVAAALWLGTAEFASVLVDVLRSPQWSTVWLAAAGLSAAVALQQHLVLRMVSRSRLHERTIALGRRYGMADDAVAAVLRVAVAVGFSLAMTVAVAVAAQGAAALAPRLLLVATATTLVVELLPVWAQVRHARFDDRLRQFRRDLARALRVARQRLAAVTATSTPVRPRVCWAIEAVQKPP